MGFKIFPIPPRNKKALWKWKDVSSNDPQQIMKWILEKPNCNWGLNLVTSNLVCIDVDTRKGGMDRWIDLIQQHGEPKTLKQITGSKGYHYIFKHHEGNSYFGTLNKQQGIEIKFKGYILIEPSLNEKGNPYNWDDIDVEIKAIPKWLKELIVKKPISREYQYTDHDIECTDEAINALIEAFRGVDLSYEDWILLGMGLHDWDSSSKGYQLYLKLSTITSSYRPGDEDVSWQKWLSFNDKSEDLRRTLRSLPHILHNNYNIPIPPEWENYDELFFEQVERKVEYNARIHKGWIFNGIRHYTRNLEWLIEHINEQGFYFYKKGVGQNFLIQYHTTGRGVSEIRCHNFFKLEKNFENKVFRYDKIMANGTVKIIDEPAINWWLKSIERNEINDISFDPTMKEGKDILNLYEGIPCEPMEGDYGPILRLIRECTCGGNLLAFNFLMDFFAHLVQCPEIKPSIVPVILGAQGTGKGFLMEFLMRGILQDMFLSVTTADELLARFNANQANKLLTFIDESTWRGNKTEDGKLKNIIGSDVLAVEEKFGARLALPNFSRYIVASNNIEAINIEDTNRRYVVIEGLWDVEGYQKEFAKYFKVKEYVKYFYKFLLERNIEFFNPYVVPKDWVQGGDTKIASMDACAQFWLNTFAHNPIRCWFEKDKKYFLNFKTAYPYFIQFKKETRFPGDYSQTSDKFNKRSIKILQLKNKYRIRTSEGQLTVYTHSPKECALNFFRYFSLNEKEYLEDFEDSDFLFKPDF